MDLDTIDTVVNMVANIAVIATLIYLAKQITQGNKLARFEARRHMVDQAQAEIYEQMHDPELVMKPENELTDLQKGKLHLFRVAVMRQREWEWFQFKDGIISEEVYKAYLEVINIHIGTETGRKWWASNGRQAFDPAFVKVVDEYLENREPSSYLKNMGKH